MERRAAAPPAAASKGHRSNIRRPTRPDPPRSPTPPPPETRRSLRPRTATLYVAADYDSPSSEEERERERERRKVKLVKLHRSPAARKPAPAPDPSSDSDSASSTSFSSYGEDDAVKPPKKRRINDGGGSDGSGQLEQPRKLSVPKSQIGFLGKSPDAAKPAKATRLPDRNVLEEVLDKLQKKDTYGVYGQPVDLEELPDYYDVIEHPMDFGTVRKKLVRSVYRTFEQFEDDVFLICSNAMQYNAPHTVYFRQARAIEEMARKNFQILRADAKSIETERKSEDKIKFSPTDEKQLKKVAYTTEKETLGSDISSSGTHASAGDTCTGSNMDRANDLKVRRANVCEKPANSITSIMPRSNALKKAASSSRLDMLSDNAVEKPALANGVSKAHTSSVQKPATSNGSSAVQAKSVEKPSAANMSSLSTEDVNAIETIASVNRLSTPQANVVEKPAAANWLSTAQDDAGKEARNAHGLTLPRADSIDKRSTSAGLSMIAANAAEKPAMGRAQADAGQEARNSHGLSSPRANSTEKCETSTGLSSMAAIPVEKPSTSNGSGKAQPNAIEQLTISKGSAECSSPTDESRSEMVDEFSAKCSPSKVGRKPILVDENRRLTYNRSEQQQAMESDPVLHIFDSEMKQLVDVGFHSENSYALSLARFAAYLGPVGWEIASDKIEKALPSDVKFGRGWVGEYEPLSTSVLSLEKQTQRPLGYGSNVQKRAPKMDKEIEVKLNATKKDDYEATQFGVQSQVNMGMAHHPKGIILCEPKQGIDGSSAETQPKISNPVLQQAEIQPRISNSVLQQAETQPRISNPVQQQAETQPRISNPVLQQPKGHVSGDSSACKEKSEQIGLCNSSSISSISVEKSLHRPNLHSEAHRQRSHHVSADVQLRVTNDVQLRVTNDVQPRVTNVVPQQRNREVDLTQVSNNASEQADVGNSSSINSILVETPFQRSHRVSADIQPRDTNVVPQQRNCEVDLTQVSNNASELAGVGNSSSINSIPVETPFQRSHRVSADIQPRVTNVVPQQQRNCEVDLTKVSNNALEQTGVGNSSSINSIPVETPVQRSHRVSADVQPRVTNVVSQGRNCEVDLTKVSNNASEQAGVVNSSSINSIPVETPVQRSHRVSADVQPRVTNVVPQGRNREVGLTKVSNNASEQAGVGNSSSINSIPVETPFQRREYPQAQKQGLFGVSSLTQPRIASTMLRQKKDQSDIDVSKTCIGASQCNLTSINKIPAETVFQRDQYHFQSQKRGLFGVSAETQRRINDTMQHQKDQAPSNLMKAYHNAPELIRSQNMYSVGNIHVEKDVQKTMFHSETATNSWPQELIARNRNQLPTEQQKETLGLTVGGLGNHQIAGSSSNNRAVTSMDFISNRQSGVAGYSLPSGSCEQAVDFRLMDLSGKMSNQSSYSNANVYNANLVRSPIPPPTRDDSSAAARTWMSFGASVERRPVDATGVVHTQIGSAPSLHSTWRTPASAVRVHGDSMMRNSQVLPHPMSFVNEESQNQNRGLVFFPQMGATDLSRFHGRPPWQGLSPHGQPRQMDTHPPDLNIGFQPSGSPVRLSSGIIVDSQQPDLALQL